MLQKSPFAKPAVIGVTLLWLTLVLFGMARLGNYERTEGRTGHPPLQWQQSAPIALDPVRPTLLMLVHPHCPCSRASLYELNHLAALCPNKAAMTVLFLKPAGCTPAWGDTDLRRLAFAIPGLCVRADENGDIARRFGAVTSGETVLYAPDGHLLYQGGLTGGRGHEGDNAGLSAVAALLAGRKACVRQEPVYGCPLTADRQQAGGLRTAEGRPWLP